MRPEKLSRKELTNAKKQADMLWGGEEGGRERGIQEEEGGA